jgi:hypothetical protein
MRSTGRSSRVGSSLARLQPVPPCTGSTRTARPAKPGTPTRLYVYDTLLERLPPDLQDMAAAGRQLIQQPHAIMGQRHVARHWHLAPIDQAHLQDGVVGARKGPVLIKAVRAP